MIGKLSSRYGINKLSDIKPLKDKLSPLKNITESGTTADRARLLLNTGNDISMKAIKGQILDPAKSGMKKIIDGSYDRLNGSEYGGIGMSLLGVNEIVHMANSAIAMNPMGVAGAAMSFVAAKGAYIAGEELVKLNSTLSGANMSTLNYVKEYLKNNGKRDISIAKIASRELYRWTTGRYSKAASFIPEKYSEEISGTMSSILGKVYSSRKTPNSSSVFTFTEPRYSTPIIDPSHISVQSRSNKSTGIYNNIK